MSLVKRFGTNIASYVKYTVDIVCLTYLFIYDSITKTDLAKVSFTANFTVLLGVSAVVPRARRKQ